jgi:hypothetical protein
MAEKSYEGFSADEKAAMKERAKELKEQAKKADGLAGVLEKINEMSGSDKTIGTRLHELVTEAVPSLEPKTWYGQPAYYKDGKVVLFFQAAEKFGTRYVTLGFSDSAQLDDGSMWPTSFAITKLSAADEKAITTLVKKAAG